MKTETETENAAWQWTSENGNYPFSAFKAGVLFSQDGKFKDEETSKESRPEESQSD